MEHFYQNIQGWFDFQRLYTLVINKLPNNSHIVEIGAWKGSSTAFLAVEIINSGKNIKLDVIDTWKGSNDGAFSAYVDDLKNNNGDIFNLFKKNLEPVKHIINPIQMPSEEAYKLYKDNSLDFVFLDGNHNYDSVKNDIIFWSTKIKKGGFIGGHDYHHKDLPGVTKAVDEFFINITIIGGDGISTPSWLVYL